MTPLENKRLHAQLREMGIDQNARREMVWKITEGRTCSTRDLTAVELEAILHWVGQQVRATRQQCDRLRKTLISQGYQCGWSVSQTKAWCEKHGVRGVKRKFNAYRASELMKLIKVMEKVMVNYGIGRDLGIKKMLKERIN